MEVNSQFVESVMAELREITATLKKIDRKIDALEYKISQIEGNS